MRKPVSLEADSDADAFREVVEEFRPALVRYFSRRVGGSEEIPDLVQEVFLRLARRRGVADVQSVRGYVFETAHNVMVDWLRRCDARRTNAHDSYDPQLHGDTDFGVDRVLMGEEDLGRVISALMELPERTRAIFILRRMEAMKYKDIADRLDVSVSTAEKEVTRAVLHLMRRFDED